MSDELNPSVKQYCQFQKNQYLANASICSIVTVQYPSTNCVGPPPWLLRRAALRSNATFTPKEVGQPEGLAFAKGESVEAL